MQRAEEAANVGKDSICFVENIPLCWTVKLGAAWNMDPRFFLNHVRRLTDEQIDKTLYRCHLPNSRNGLDCVGGEAWTIVRGYVDYGRPKWPLTGDELVDTSKRQHQVSVFETRLSHTNVSFYKINDHIREWLLLLIRTFCADHSL